MRLVHLTYIAFHLNHLLDEKVFISIEETKEKIKSRSIIPYLKSLTTKFDTSLYSLFTEEEVEDLCLQIEGWYEDLGHEGVGVHSNGICLLLSGVINLIQRKTDNIIFDK